MKSVSMFTFLALGLSASAFAQTPPAPYNVDVARVQMDLSCNLSQANGGTVSCSTNLSASGDISISMTPNTDPTQPGFNGLDVVNDPKGDYMLVLNSDATQALQNLTMFRMAQDAQGGFDLGLAVAQTNSVVAVNVAPFHIQVQNDQSIQIDLTFVAYGPAGTSNMVSKADKKSLTDFVLKKIQPAINAARNK